MVGERKLLQFLIGYRFASSSSVHFRSNFSPIQEGGCTLRLRVSDTRCGTYVICPAYLQSRCSPS